MAEGDTIKRAKLRLQPVLRGQSVSEFWVRKLRGHRPRVGQKITEVRSVGKHLLVDFDNKLTLDTHLGMHGSWRVFNGKELSASASVRFNPGLKVIIATSVGYALCFKAPTVQTFVRDSKSTPLANLGPDLCDDKADVDEIVDRVKKLDHKTPLVDVLLDQNIACGIGNIYKSETLHIQKIYPFKSIVEMGEGELKDLYLKAAEVLKRNSRTGGQKRQIAPQGGFFVYERFRYPCLRCDTPISRSYDGKNARSTYWCRVCQPR